MDEYRVPKRKTSVGVLLPGGTERTVEVFLSEQAAQHEGAERLDDLLNGPDEFIPAFDVATATFTVLSRAGIAVARVAREVDFEPIDEHTLPTEHEVEVTLLDGRTLRGVVSYVRPPDRSRLTDYLNENSPFILLLEIEHVALVNKRHVARIANLSR